MKISVKSIPDNFEKEKSGIKPCTIRTLDGEDKLEITNTETHEKIERIITDITSWKGVLIISFASRDTMPLPEALTLMGKVKLPIVSFSGKRRSKTGVK